MTSTYLHIFSPHVRMIVYAFDLFMKPISIFAIILDKKSPLTVPLCLQLNGFTCICVRFATEHGFFITVHSIIRHELKERA